MRQGGAHFGDDLLSQGDGLDDLDLVAPCEKVPCQL